VVVRSAGQRIFQHNNSAARDSESKLLELLLSSSRLVFPLYRTPPTTETFSYPTASFPAPTLVRARTFYNSLTFVPFDDVAPKCQYRQSKGEVEAWYPGENFSEDFQVLQDGRRTKHGT
jgi:hypothetical protein